MYPILQRCAWRTCAGAVALLASAAVPAADAIPGEEWCDRPVIALAFAGNEVTRDQVMGREVEQVVGAPCSLDRIVDSIRNLQDLGLFKQVSARIDLHADEAAAGDAAGDAAQGVRVTFAVREKFFFLAIPRLSRTSDRELRTGLQLRWDNFTGRLHQLKLTSEVRRQDDGRGESGQVHSLDYEVPRFFNSDYGMAVDLAGVDQEVELARDGIVFGDAIEQSYRLGLNVARWFNRYEGLVGLRVFAGALYSTRRYNDLAGELGPFVEGHDLNVLIGAETQAVHQDAFRRRGMRYGASLRIGSEAIGSDFNHHRLDVWLRWYKPLTGGLRNLNVQTRIGISDGAPYGEYAYAIGGGEMLRGLEPSAYEGDVMTLVNVEYLSALFRYPNLRWVGFVDVGNVYDKDSVRLLSQRLRGGLGLRWKIQALTNTDLRVDLALDPATGSPKFYASTSLTF